VCQTDACVSTSLSIQDIVQDKMRQAPNVNPVFSDSEIYWHFWPLSVKMGTLGRSSTDMASSKNVSHELWSLNGSNNRCAAVVNMYNRSSVSMVGG
jgi:hypothetical protein